jgi:hypothetical protein
MSHGQRTAEPRLRKVTLGARLDDPLLRLGLLLTVVPFAVLAVPIEWANRSQDPPEYLAVPVPPSSTSTVAPHALPATDAGPSADMRARPDGGANAGGSQPGQAVPSSSSSPQSGFARPQTAQEVYDAWLIVHPVVRDADLTAAGTLDGQMPHRSATGLRQHEVTDLGDAGAPLGVMPRRPRLVGQRRSDTLDIIRAEQAAAASDATADVDLSKAGTPLGVPPALPHPVGERAEQVLDLARGGSPPGAAPRIPTRDEP